MMAEHVDLNNLCVTSAANLCKTRLDDRTLLAYCYASCAYASRYVFESGDLGEAFRAKVFHWRRRPCRRLLTGASLG